MKKIILIFLFYVGIVNAQNYSLGFDLELHQIRVGDQDGTQILGGDGFPLGIHLIFIYSPSNKIAISAKIGRTFHIEFLGWEFGANGRYNFYKSLYISAGLMQHSNEGGSSISGAEYASILMLQIGIGFDISSVTSIELDYYFPTYKKIIGWSRGFDSDGEIYSPYKFQSMITLNFIFAWKL